MTYAAFLRRVWPAICAAYRDDGLATACIAMQNRFRADIPFLLVLGIVDRVGHGPGKTELAKLVAASRDWQEAAIAPLRHIRKSMKGRFTAPAEMSLRDDIKRLELEAERLHVQRIAALFPDAGESSERSAHDYLTMCGAPAADAAEFIEIFNVAFDAQVVPAVELD